MRAGELKYVLVFESPALVTSPTGAVTKSYKEVFCCRAGRKKADSASDDGECLRRDDKPIRSDVHLCLSSDTIWMPCQVCGMLLGNTDAGT